VEQVPEQAEGTAGSPTHEVRDFLRRRREQIAQRWADEALFRAVFTVSRDEAVEAGKAVVDGLAQVADAQRVEDPDAAGFTTVREQLARMGAARSRAGLSTAQVSSELAALRPPVENLLLADLPDASPEEARACVTTLSVLMGTLRVASGCSCWRWPLPSSSCGTASWLCR
jgi:rsbT co-antagonist protein RsbR